MKGMKGTTAECLAHYAQTLPPPASKNVKQARQHLVDFCGVGMPAVSEWVLGRRLPVGDPLVKLRFFLELMGYEVAELKRLNRAAYQLAEMIAFGLSIQEAVAITGLAKTQSVHALALGKTGTMKDRETRIDREWNTRKEAIESKRNEWRERLGVSTEQAEPVSKKPQPHVQTVSTSTHGSDLETLGHLILAMIPLAERVVSDDFSPAERRRLREMTFDTGVFRLSNALEALCGETAREQVLSNSNSKSTATRNGER